MFFIKKTFLTFLIIFLLFHVLATVYYWYWKFTWLDIPMHFLGGFLTAMLFAYFIYPKLQIINHKTLIAFILFISFSALIGIFWEFYEFFYDIFISSRGFSGVMQYGAADTIADLLMDLSGAFVFSAIFMLSKKYFYSSQE
ncbi:hypothetical protein A2999_02125 [Candidatus Wolfebacteria bacterium RIFCSPLOWO2_01_FULL_38_11]|uniref:Uncharacterized protein n=2 Tax=Candidatus Wolfeibacteriota TaxID=1752735 RepID=A0A0G0IDL9_9BACT|nr:MAG: hypothetical protein US36_C0008G0011 [Candidatus Wolfebacteria bacterium GW2011_GWC1_37_10]OGM92023.1 MAG: hypothetical protein A2999_02125 [Candidatus Wolfebacteria bacterium RIFCSPLOWO2_01_FULL_38_11]